MTLNVKTVKVDGSVYVSAADFYKAVDALEKKEQSYITIKLLKNFFTNAIINFNERENTNE